MASSSSCYHHIFLIPVKTYTMPAYRHNHTGRSRSGFTSPLTGRLKKNPYLSSEGGIFRSYGDMTIGSLTSDGQDTNSFILNNVSFTISNAMLPVKDFTVASVVLTAKEETETFINEKGQKEKKTVTYGEMTLPGEEGSEIPFPVCSSDSFVSKIQYRQLDTSRRYALEESICLTSGGKISGAFTFFVIERKAKASTASVAASDTASRGERAPSRRKANKQPKRRLRQIPGSR